jgi:beta-N-acetylhexosaminidase
VRQPSIPRVPTTVRATAPWSSAVRRPAVSAVVLGLLVGVAACGNGGSGSPASSAASAASSPAAGTTGSSVSPSGSASASNSSSASTPVPPATKPTTTRSAADCVDRAVSAMSQAQRVGQLFMSPVTSTGMKTAEATAISQGRVGSVILMGHTSLGTAAVKPVADRVQALAPVVKGVKVRMLVSTDQEGGQVQVLKGPGFSTMPSAVTQGQWSASQLQSSAAQWARQLQAAGVNMNLAPVADTVPPDLVSVNAPIGQLDREYGTTPSTVATHSDAFLRGMRQGGVVPTAKHFPGLGRVRGNTDLTANVVDSTTTRTDPFLQPFRSAVQAGVPFVMVSSATYSRIDSAHQAAFSSVVIRDMLRGSLGFKGAVISDDLGRAVAVSDRTPAQRALDFIGAGGNLVLTVRASDIGPMTSAVISRMATDAALRASVDDSVRRVLTAKHNAGLLTCG